MAVGSASWSFTEEDFGAITKALQKFLGETNARCALLVDRSGQLVATVGEHRLHNVHVRDGISADEFVAMRMARDAALDMPTLVLPAIQVNIRAGELPKPEANGVRYLKIPVNTL